MIGDPNQKEAVVHLTPTRGDDEGLQELGEGHALQLSISSPGRVDSPEPLLPTSERSEQASRHGNKHPSPSSEGFIELDIEHPPLSPTRSPIAKLVRTGGLLGLVVFLLWVLVAGFRAWVGKDPAEDRAGLAFCHPLLSLSLSLSLSMSVSPCLSLSPLRFFPSPLVSNEEVY